MLGRGFDTIYPVLREFEQGGYVTVEAEVVSGRERKVYTLTECGRAAFKVAVEAWMDVTRSPRSMWPKAAAECEAHRTVAGRCL